MLICILTKNVITSCRRTMMLFLHLEVKPLMTLTTVLYLSCAFFFNDTATTEIYTLSLHDALPISAGCGHGRRQRCLGCAQARPGGRSEEHTSELQSPCNLVCRLLLEKKNVITSCSVTMMLFLHLQVKPLMTLTTVLYLSCALISVHLAMMLMELTKRR